MQGAGVISGNCAYRKYLHQCCENGEEWALKVSANVATVSTVVKELHALVDRVLRLPNSRLGKVCGEIVSSMHSPDGLHEGGGRPRHVGAQALGPGGGHQKQHEQQAHPGGERT